MINNLIFVAIILLSVFPVGCSAQQMANLTTIIMDGKKVYVFPIKKKGKFFFFFNYDLCGKIFAIPEGVELVAKGGTFMNGTLIGRGTTIEGDKALFDHVKITGDWNVPNISTTLFKDLTYDNSLKDVFALSSSVIDNKITVEKGMYKVTTTPFNEALLIKSNTELIISGVIQLLPNDFSGCYVLGIKKAKNVVIRGDGKVEGDRFCHIGTAGEWGHGINVDSSDSVLISEITISNCWGDCIYVGNNSSNITISGCKLRKGRRQGISITSGHKIKVINCIISDIRGTDPQYAIDVEPNKNECVNDVLIENVRVNNCYGGFSSWGGAPGSTIGTIMLRRCSVKGTKANYPVRFTIGKEVVIEDCVFETGKQPGVFTDVVNRVKVKNNVIHSTNPKAVHIRRVIKREELNNKIIKKENG